MKAIVKDALTFIENVQVFMLTQRKLELETLLQL